MSANLHSLINGKWFIHEQYGRSLLPSLFSIIEGKALFKVEEKDRPEFHFITGSKLSPKSGNVQSESGGQTDYVAIINLKDPIYKYDQDCGPYGTKTKMRRIAAYGADPNCKGIVLDIDSGGGQVSGTPEFHDFIKGFSKPVVAYTDGCMCSAAYYIGAASSYIIANKRADAIGSIGVMIYFINMDGMWEKKGATIISEYATQSTEKNRAFEELIDGKPELYIKTELDPIAAEFISDMKAVRSDLDEEVFKGGTWGADEALDKKLIDQIGTLQDAVNKVFELADAPENESTNNLNNSNMPKIKSSPGLAKALGIEGDGLELRDKSWLSSTEGVFLESSQVETLETLVAGHATAIETEKGKVTTAEGKVTALTSAVNSAIEAAGLTADVAADATTEAKIALLGAKVKEYAKAPKVDATKPKSEGDSFEEENAIVNPKDAHNSAYANA